MEMTASSELLMRGSERVREDEVAERAAAFAGLVERQARLMFRVAMSVLRNETDAEDAVQEAFLKLYRTGAWMGMREERAFVAKVVWRAALDRAGRSKSAFETSLLLQDGSEMELVSAVESAETVQVRAGEEAELRRLIDGLPEELRRPLLLSAIEEMSSAEVGVVLGIGEGTVRTRVLRARRELRKRFEARLARGRR